MSIYFNGTKVTSVTLDGKSLTKVVDDGVTVFDATLNALIPTMTSDTAPTGTGSVSRSNSTDNTNYKSYYAFDNNSKTCWLTNVASNGEWIKYSFNKERVVQKAVISIGDGRPGVTADITIYLQASNDNSNWTNLKSFTAKASDATKTSFTNSVDSSTDDLYTHTYTFNNVKEYKHYRLYSSGKWQQGSTGYWGVYQMQLYGYMA